MPMCNHSYLFALLAGVLALSGRNCLAAEPVDTALREEFAKFTQAWDEAAWLPKEGRVPAGYMRPLDDAGWKARMICLHALVSAGVEAAPTVRDRLLNGSDPERILAAQASGYLGDPTLAADLTKSVQEDPVAAVRLYAVDSLGMLGVPVSAEDLTAWEDAERNRDVRQHLAYLRKRDGAVLHQQVVQRLREWNSSVTNSPKVGEAAPDFSLPALDGEHVRLSDYRGKSAVVLVFIYGDT
jgi:hypothetical protein